MSDVTSYYITDLDQGNERKLCSFSNLKTQSPKCQLYFKLTVLLTRYNADKKITYMPRTCSWHGQQERKILWPMPNHVHPTYFLSGSVGGAVFIRTQVGPTKTAKDLSKEFMKVTFVVNIFFSLAPTIKKKIWKHKIKHDTLPAGLDSARWSCV